MKNPAGFVVPWVASNKWASKRFPEVVSRSDLGLKIKIHKQYEKHRIASSVQKPTAESIEINMTSMPQHLSHNIHWECSRQNLEDCGFKQTKNKDRSGRGFSSLVSRTLFWRDQFTNTSTERPALHLGIAWCRCWLSLCGRLKKTVEKHKGSRKLE